MSRRGTQPQVHIDALPLVATAGVSTSFVDCSKIDAVTYSPDNPCQTFVLLTSEHFSSASAFWTAETRAMKIAGWRHSARQPPDYDGAYRRLASRRQSWVAPAQRACAYITTDRAGVAAEEHALFQYDPNDNPRGLYVYYHRAKAAARNVTLWVRLRPPNHGGRCVG
jgi:hypothetical protein